MEGESKPKRQKTEYNNEENEKLVVPTISANTVALTDPNFVKKMIAFTKDQHSFGNKMTDDICIIQHENKPIACLRNPHNDGEKQYPYATEIMSGSIIGVAPRTYHAIGQSLAYNHSLATIKSIASIVLKMFRSKPIEKDLNELIGKIRAEGNNKSLNALILDISILAGAMACEAGRGETGLTNFFTILHILKNLDSSTIAQHFSVDVAASINANTDYKTIITEQLFSKNYGDKTGSFEKTSIAVGYSGSQQDIQNASNNRAASFRYRTMLARDVAFVQSLTTSKNSTKDAHLSHAADEAKKRKVDQHAHYLFGRSIKDVDSRIADKMCYLLETRQFELCGTLVAEWENKGYLAHMTIKDIDAIAEEIRGTTPSAKDLEILETICDKLCNNIPTSNEQQEKAATILAEAYSFIEEKVRSANNI